MQIEVFDVGHGHCSVITTPAGHKIMVDCGTKSGDRLWWPSTHHLGKEIGLLALMNLDEDHIRDFEDVLKNCGVRSVLTNPTIGPVQLRALKPEPMGPGTKALLKWMSAPKRGGADPVFDVDLQWFYNPYGGTCRTTNDLSLALFVRYGDFVILFAGDLEAAGWGGMMKNALFRQWAATVNIFVASHHGRDNGCCEELFRIMKPEIIVISDDVMKHDTQETNGWYRQRCHGVGYLADPSRRRFVLTTRDDGSMRLNVKFDGSWTLDRNVEVPDFPRQIPTTYGVLGDGFGGFGLLGQSPTNALLQGSTASGLLGLINRC